MVQYAANEETLLFKVGTCLPCSQVTSSHEAIRQENRPRSSCKAQEYEYWRPSLLWNITV